MKTKIFAVLALVGAISLGVVPFAGAQTSTSTPVVNPERPMHLPGNTVQISPSGQANIVGTVAAVSGGSVSVNSWGGVWNVSTASDTIITGLGGKIDVSQIQAGDTIMVHGAMQANSGLVIQARVIKEYAFVNNANSTSTHEMENPDHGNSSTSQEGHGNGDQGNQGDQGPNPGFWGRIFNFFHGGRG